MKCGYMMPPVLLAVVAAMGCGGADDDERADAAAAAPAAAPATEQQQQPNVATAYATGSDRLSPEELEAGRMDMSWREFVRRDTGAASRAPADGPNADASRSASTSRADGGADPERWEDISPESVNSGPIQLPVFGDVEGPSVVRVQVLLDRALFSPGVIDGRWGRNTEKAVYWLQEREGLEPTGEVDERTWERLQQLARSPQQLVSRHTLTQDDVAGPFVTLPEEYYDRRDMECQCYESLAEKLAERFHTTEALLEQLNPDADLNSVAAGQTLHVPAVADRGGAAGAHVARLVVSDGGGYLHALDASGRIVYHFPATLGADYSPSPTGDFRVTSIAPDPTWHYQPDILAGVADDKPDAVLPPGPNNAVGTVWMALSKPHYGIHGTSAPETIGYATSNGCVRLTNWDAEFLSQRIEEGIAVEFRDVTG
jgi:lipoprotein-anchoring transpeptidase ErfK/SrfK